VIGIPDYAFERRVLGTFYFVILDLRKDKINKTIKYYCKY